MSYIYIGLYIYIYSNTVIIRACHRKRLSRQIEQHAGIVTIKRRPHGLQFICECSNKFWYTPDSHSHSPTAFRDQVKSVAARLFSTRSTNKSLKFGARFLQSFCFLPMRFITPTALDHHKCHGHVPPYKVILHKADHFWCATSRHAQYVRHPDRSWLEPICVLQ